MELSLSASTILFALAGGILPSLAWLWFWLREDAKKPEPHGLLLTAFIVGMLAVPVTFFVQKFAHDNISNNLELIAVWALIEELLIFSGAYYVAFRKVCSDGSLCLDEPLDPMIYMITVALGFAALENTLFLISPLEHGTVIQSFLTGNLRFLGATLLHVVCSATVGAMMSFTFYKSTTVKRIFIVIGIAIATLLHTLFNFFIIISEGKDIFFIFISLWIVVILFLAVFEKVKKISPTTL